MNHASLRDPVIVPKRRSDIDEHTQRNKLDSQPQDISASNKLMDDNIYPQSRTEGCPQLD